MSPATSAGDSVKLMATSGRTTWKDPSARFDQPDEAQRIQYLRPSARSTLSFRSEPSVAPPLTGISPGNHQRRPATAREAKALSHPLRLRILRLCGLDELTNKQLADRLEQDPGTVLYHVRQLVTTGFLEQGDVRTGTSGALEKPYRSTGRSWWLSDALMGTEPDTYLAPVEAFREELRQAGPEAITMLARLTLHLSSDDARALDERLQEVLDEYISTDHERSHLPAYGGIVVLHESQQSRRMPPDTPPH